MISVIIATRNRARLLEGLLNSLAAQRNGAHVDHEILVVDNGSSDGTPEVARSCPGTRYLQEETIGLSYARNRGLAEARGDVVAYLDDDCIADPDWLASMAKCFEETSPDAVGGMIVPSFQSDPPPWLGPCFRSALGELDLGTERRVLRGRESVNGGNMAFTRRALEETDGFATGFGRNDGGLGGFDDAIAVGRIIASGGTVIYDPAVLVEHVIDEQRLTWEYFLRLATDTGKSMAHIDMRRFAGAALGRRPPGQQRPYTPVPTDAGTGYITGRLVFDASYLAFCAARAMVALVYGRDSYQRRSSVYSRLVAQSMMVEQWHVVSRGKGSTDK